MKKKLIKLIYLLRKKKLKLAIAESCTGGMLSTAITSVSGSSKIFTMGLVTYSNDSKISILSHFKYIHLILFETSLKLILDQISTSYYK